MERHTKCDWMTICTNARRRTVGRIPLVVKEMVDSMRIHIESLSRFWSASCIVAS